MLIMKKEYESQTNYVNDNDNDGRDDDEDESDDTNNDINKIFLPRLVLMVHKKSVYIPNNFYFQ